jgi:hypothetical protein
MSAMKHLYLIIAILVLAACERLQPAPQIAAEVSANAIIWQASAPPVGVDSITDVQGNWYLYGGQELHQGYAYPDGRVWLYDANNEKHYQLTSEAHFGQHFFASAGIFIGDYRVLVKVNTSLEQETLYLIDLSDSTIRRWLSASDLGLVEIIGDTWLVTPDRGQLAFSAFREISLSNQSFVWQLGVYSLDIETRELETIALEPLDQEPGYLVPALDEGRIVAASL